MTADRHGPLVPTAAQRAAAAGALLTPPAMVALLLVALWNSAGLLIAAVLLVPVVAASVWVALTHHGLLRAGGAVLAAVAVAAQVALFVNGRHGVVWLLGLIVLLAVYGLAARAALRPHVAARHDASADRQVPPAERPVLIMNLKSGGGKAEKFDLAGEARKRGIEPVILRPGDDLLQLAEDAIARGADVIGMAGGDGSQALIATVAMKHDVPHVCVPAGTRNHFALDIGLDRNDVVGALEAFQHGIERRIDLARVNDRVFVNNASLGVYAKVVQSAAYRDAKLETWARKLPELLGPGAPAFDLEFTMPGGETVDDAPLILVSNNAYQLTRLAGAGTRARIDAGVLGVVAARINSPGDVARLAALEVAGQAERFPGLLEWESPAFEVRSTGPVEVGLDGEALLLEAPLQFVSLPGALRVRIPRHAPGFSPAAGSVSLTPASLARLGRVALGRPPAEAVD